MQSIVESETEKMPFRKQARGLRLKRIFMSSDTSQWKIRGAGKAKVHNVGSLYCLHACYNDGSVLWFSLDRKSSKLINARIAPAIANDLGGLEMFSNTIGKKMARQAEAWVRGRQPVCIDNGAQHYHASTAPFDLSIFHDVPRQTSWSLQSLDY